MYIYIIQMYNVMNILFYIFYTHLSDPNKTQFQKTTVTYIYSHITVLLGSSHLDIQMSYVAVVKILHNFQQMPHVCLDLHFIVQGFLTEPVQDTFTRNPVKNTLLISSFLQSQTHMQDVAGSFCRVSRALQCSLS